LGISCIKHISESQEWEERDAREISASFVMSRCTFAIRLFVLSRPSRSRISVVATEEIFYRTRLHPLSRDLSHTSNVASFSIVDRLVISPCKSVPRRIRICICRTVDGCEYYSLPCTRKREDFAFRARSARIGTARGTK